MAQSARLAVILLASVTWLWTVPSARSACNNILADIVFVMDSSGSVGSGNFDIMKVFVQDFVLSMKAYISPNAARLSVIRFDTYAAIVFDLDDHPLPDDLIAAITSVPYPAGGTATHLALDLVRTSLLFNTDRGAREGVTKLVVLMTDGESNDPALTKSAAQNLRNAGARIMAVGIAGAKMQELNDVASDPSYVQSVVGFGGLNSIQQHLLGIACRPVCSWLSDHCWPGDCANVLAENCQCRTGFTTNPNSVNKLCQLSRAPDIATCRLALRDASGNQVMSRTSGGLQHCNNQLDEFTNIQPTTLTYDLKADLQQALGSYPHYVSQSQVGVTGFNVRLIKVSLANAYTEVSQTSINQSPICSANAGARTPAQILECNSNYSFPSAGLTDGERLCVETTAQGGGYYTLQDFSKVTTGTELFPTITATRTVCFTHDRARPQHCSGVSPSPPAACTQPPLQLSTRLTRSRQIRVQVPDWFDPVPAGGDPSRASGVAKYQLDVHGVDVANSFLAVQPAARMSVPLTGGPPFDVAVTLPENRAQLYAILLEVHDNAGNVGYARRFLLYDDSSRVLLDPGSPLRVSTANSAAVTYTWHTSVTNNLCLDWKNRFYNDVFNLYDYMLPVQQDSARAISGVYDQVSGVLPVSGTPSARGVVRFEVSWSLNGGSPSPWQNVANVTAQAHCLSLPLQDGQTYDVTVRGYDIMANSNSDDVTVHVDHTPPAGSELGLRGRWGRAGLYVHGSTDLSTMTLVVEGSDPHSGLGSLVWSVGTNDSLADVGRRAIKVQAINRTACLSGRDGLGRACYCPLVTRLPCEVFLYNVTFTQLLGIPAAQGDHHRHYFINLHLQNNAGLESTVSTKVLVDVSPPTRGVVMEGEADAAELDFTSSDVLHVRWHSFVDLESGVLLYRVVLAQRCLTDLEMDAALNATEVSGSTSDASNRATFRLSSTGRYFTSVVAYNGALTPSPVACSDGIVYDTSAPRLLNVTLAHARFPPSLACARQASGDVTPWLVNSNLTKVALLPNVTECSQLCRQNNSGDVSVDHLPNTVASALGVRESALACRTLPMITDDTWIVLPSDRLLMTWASEDPESQIEAFHVGAGTSRLSALSPDLIRLTTTHGHQYFHIPHPGLGHGAMFFLFLRATSKTGQQSLLTLGPVLVDSTAPQVQGGLEAAVSDGQLVVTWLKGQVVDPEQPARTELTITFRVGYSQSFVTPFIETSSADFPQCRLKNATIGGCLRYPIASLRAQDARAGRAFFFQIHVQNAAGLSTAVNTSSVTLPGAVTSQGVVLDFLPSGPANGLEVTDVDVIFLTDRVCMGWSRISLRGSSGVEELEVSVGLGTNASRDDVIPFSNKDVTAGRACVNASGLPMYVRLYSVVNASSPSAWATFASDGFVLVPPGHPDNRLQVFVGRGCSSQDSVGAGRIPAGGDRFDLTRSVTSAVVHAGDVLFVAFDPVQQGVTFPDAVVILTTLYGYQVVLGGNSLLVNLPTVAIATVSVRVSACRKEDSTVVVQQKDGTPFLTSWEIYGPWAGLSYSSLVVKVVDLTCQRELPPQAQSSNGPSGAASSCLVSETRVVSPHVSSVAFPPLGLYEGRLYTSSLALCFDNGCTDPVWSHGAWTSPRNPSLEVNSAVLVSQQGLQVGLQIAASASGLSTDGTCVFMLGISRVADASHLLSDWQLHTDSHGCWDLQLNVTVAVKLPPDGTLFLCLRLLHPSPLSSGAVSCKKVTRHPQTAQVQAFLVVETSHDVLVNRDLSPYLTSQQLGSRVHDLYDLDLDFVSSDRLLAAVVTNSARRQVRWFLMEDEARFPKGDDCTADSACAVEAQASSSMTPGTVTFPRYATKLRHGTVYYACALVLARQTDVQEHLFAGFSEEQRACGDGFVVDDLPPVGGTASINNAGAGYLADGGVVTVTWRGFSDVENDVTTPLPDDTTLAYFAALGSFPGAADVAPFVAVGDRTAWTFEGLRVKDGTFCYATVRATDKVGHVTEVTSEPVVLDNSPPSQGLVAAGSFAGDLFVSGQGLHVHSRGISDVHSGIASQWLAVSARGGHDDVMPYFLLEGDSVVVNASQFLLDGHSYVILLKSTNRAGLTSVTSSELFTVDSSPPESGSVWNGAPGTNEHVSYLTDTHAYSVHWSHFTDPHSGLALYRVGLGSAPGLDDVVPFHDVGLSMNYTWRRQFDQGRPYYAAVQGCNRVRMCTIQVSASVTFDNSPPSSGQVTVGTAGTHSHFYGHNTTLQVQWTGFVDPQSGVREFWWCLGTRSGACDVKPLSTSLGVRYVTGLVTLPQNVRLYVTVRAFNYAGLRTEGVSQWFVVDLTPPQLLAAPSFLVPATPSGLLAQPDRSLLRLAWRFSDREAPVVSTLVLVHGEVQGRQAREPVSVEAGSRLTLPLSGADLLADGDRYRLTVVACNAAGLCALATSPSLLVDSTPPVVGRFGHRLAWTSSPPLTQIQVDWTGFADPESSVMTYHLTAGRNDSDTSLSKGVIHLPHNPSADVQTLTLSTNERLSAPGLVVMSLWAENALGIYSDVQRMTFVTYSGWLMLQRYSCSPHYCTNECTCTPEGQVCVPSNSLSAPCEVRPSSSDLTLTAFVAHNGSQQDFVSSAKCLEGRWAVTAKSGNLNVVRFEYSFSLNGSDPGQGVMDAAAEKVWRDAGLLTSALYCLPLQGALERSAAYVLHVRAWLSKNTYVAVTSLPVLVDHTPPLQRRGRAVVESANSSCGVDLDVISTQTTSLVLACWAGVFSDPDSGISSYDVWVGTTPFADDFQKEVQVGATTSYKLNVTSMTEATRYYVSVRAWNGAGLSTAVVSDGLLLDSTPPAPGYVFLASRHAVDHATDDVARLPVTWHGFEDLESGVTSYSVALYDVSVPSRPVVDYLDVGFEAVYALKGLTLLHGHSYKAAVKAHSPSGLESDPSFSAAILVDVTPPEGAACTLFRLERAVNLSVMANAPLQFRHQFYFTTMSMDMAAANQILKVIVKAPSMTADAVAEMTFEPYLTMPLHFRYDVSNSATADHLLMTTTSGAVNISVEVQAAVGAALTAELYSCLSPLAVPASSSWSSTTLSSTVSGARASSSSDGGSPDAVVLEQVSVTTVMVCSMVLDAESGLMSLRVGVGTTPGGLQVVPLTPVGQAGHLMMEVTAQQGTTLYATAVAENHAQVLSRFISRPIVFDTTPPAIGNVRLSISYVRTASDINATSATALANWTATDGESGGVTCTCHLEGHETPDAAIQTSLDFECQWRLGPQLRHGARVHVVVTCMNRVQIWAALSSAEVVILQHPPEFKQPNLHVLYNFPGSSPYDHTSYTDVRSSRADLEVSWRSTGDVSIDHFRYRFLVNQVTVSDWSSLPAYKTAALFQARALPRLGNVTVEVTAIDGEGMTSAVASSAVTVSDDPPLMTGRTAHASLEGGELLLNWTGVFLTDHDDVIYAVYAGTQAELGDVINQAVTESTTHRVPCDLALQQLHVLIHAVYLNGLEGMYKGVVPVTNSPSGSE